MKSDQLRIETALECFNGGLKKMGVLIILMAVS